MTRVSGLPGLFLHACCAPCAPRVIQLLSAEYDVTVFFFNPNVHPAEEYDRRCDELRRFCEAEGIPFIEGPRDRGAWAEVVRGLEGEPEGGARCEKCFGLRLAETARRAAGAGCGFFTTTLTVSPRKNAGVINRIGREAGEGTGVVFLEKDFKKKDGYKISCELSRERGFYRQDYCGCEQSKRRDS